MNTYMSLALGADLVQSIGATDDHTSNQTHQLQTLDHKCSESSGMDTDDDSSWLGRVAEGTHEVEDGGDAQFLAGDAGVLHGGVVGLRKEEAESMVVQQGCNHFWPDIVDPAANLFQNIGRSTSRRSSPVTVLYFFH